MEQLSKQLVIRLATVANYVSDLLACGYAVYNWEKLASIPQSLSVAFFRYEVTEQTSARLGIQDSQEAVFGVIEQKGEDVISQLQQLAEAVSIAGDNNHLWKQVYMGTLLSLSCFKYLFITPPLLIPPIFSPSLGRSEKESVGQKAP